MNFLRSSLLCILLANALGVSTSKAQTNSCALTAGRLPEVRGLKLGMTTRDVKIRHPELPVGEPDEFGYVVSDISSSYVQSALRPPDGEDLDSVTLAFLDGRLVKFRVTYNGLTKWPDADEFLKALISNLKLPAASAWKVIDPSTRQLDCADTSIQVKLEPAQSRYELQRPSIAFVLNDVDKVLAERRLRREQRQQERLQATAPLRSGTNTLLVEAYVNSDRGDVPATGATFFLLDADPLKLFDEEDVRLTRFLSDGEDEDEALIAEYLASARMAGSGSFGRGSQYLKEFYTSAMAALKPHIVQTAVADAAGKASFSAVGASTYYLIGGAKPPAYAVWKLKIESSSPQVTVRLNRSNTMAGLRTRDSDEENEKRRRQDEEKRRRVFKP